MRIYIEKLIELAKLNPEKPLIVDHESRRVTSRMDFLDKARRIAGYIRSKNIPANSFLPIVMDGCMEYLAADFGCWMAGHASVHLSDSYPEARIKFIISDSKAPFVIDKDFINKALMNEPDEHLAERTDESYAIMFYTSGSTGNPKGVVHTDKFFCFGNQNLLLSPNDSFVEEDVYAPTTPMYFVVSQLIYGAIWSGATVHILSDEIKHDIRNMENYLAEHDVTVGFMPPSMLREFHNKGKCLKRVITGGEKLVNATPPKDFAIHQIYGQTEAPFYILSFTLDKFYERVPMTPIGKMEVKLVDDECNEVPQGSEGELLIKLPVLPIYLNNEEKNAQVQKEGWLHSQDLMIQNEKGEYIYVNRKDWMVKINGQRIEPGEIENVMKRIDGVRDCVVKGISSPLGDRQYLVGFYLAERDLGYDFLVAELGKKLPDYMIPKILVRMEEFPKNANGKIDRKALLPPDESALLSEYVAPTNDIEAGLCDAFAEVMGFKQVGIEDDFFRLGGNSIQMMRIQQICSELAVEKLRTMSTKLIYQGRTPKGIAALLSQIKEQKKEILDDYPLSGIQRSYYQICRSLEGKPVFNVSNLIRLNSRVDMQRLAAAIQKVVQRHPGLHVRLFENENGEVRQKRMNEPWTIEVERMSDEALNAEKKKLVQPFYLLKDRLFRIRLFETEKSKYFFYDIHHIVYDGASQIIFFRDIENAYQNVAVDPEDWNMLEMAAEENHIRETQVFSDARDWYRRKFADAQPVKRPDTIPDASPKLTRLMTTLDVSPVDVDHFCQSSGITVNALTTAAFALMLGQYANSKDVVFASAYNAREDARVRNTVGLFARPVFIRTQWSDNTLTKEFLQSMRRNLLECMDNSIYSYAEMQADIPMSPGYLFIFQGELTEEPVIGGYATESVPIVEKQAVSAIEAHLFLDSKAKQFKLEMLYKQAFYSDEYIKRMIGHYQTVLKGMMSTVQLNDARCLVSKQDKF